MDKDKPKPRPARRSDVLHKLNSESLYLIERGLSGNLPKKLRPQSLVPVRGRQNELEVAKEPSFLPFCLPIIPDSPQSEFAATSSDDEQVVTLKKSFSFRQKFSRMSIFGKDKDKTDKNKCKTISEAEREDQKHGDHANKSPSPKSKHEQKHNKRFWFFRNKEIHEKQQQKQQQRQSNVYVRSKSFEFLPRALEEEEEMQPATTRPRLKTSMSYVFGSSDSIDDWMSNDEREYPSNAYYDNDDGVFLKGIRGAPASESSTNNSSMSIGTSASSGIVVNMFKTPSVQDILNNFNKAVEMFSETYLSDSEPYTKHASGVMPTAEKRKSSSFSTLPSPKVLQVNKVSELSADFKVELTRVLSVKRNIGEVKPPSARRGSVTDWFVLEDMAAAAAGAPFPPSAAGDVNKYRRAQQKPTNRVRRISSTKYGREMIARVYHFLKKEYEFTDLYREPNSDISHLRNITKRTALATGVGERTVVTILKEQRNLTEKSDGPSTSKSEPQTKKQNSRENKVEINDIAADVVRSTILNFHNYENQSPSLTKLKSNLHERIGFDGSLETLQELLIKSGFKWRKTDNNRKILVERHNIQMLRLQYLKKIADYRSQGRPIVYTDESCVLTIYDGTSVQKDKRSRFCKKVNTVTHFILVHAGSDDGFINNACLLYKTNANVGDNYSNITFENYMEWLDEKLLPYLPERSVIVLDASHHNTRAEKLPTAASTKSEMQEWLTTHRIRFDARLRKIELYDMIKKHNNNCIKYEIDYYIKTKGFEVLRLPPYHPELNAIKSILEVLKNNISLRNVEDNKTSPETLIYECISKINPEIWSDTCNRIIKKEVEYLKYFDNDFAFIIELEDETADASDSSTTSSDST